MLTPNVNQFIPQDYYASLPTTQLDAKKSPLALLAQTCSQIGTDSSNMMVSKSSLNGLPDKLSKTRDKSSPSSSSNGSSPVASVKSSFKPYESCLKDSEKTYPPIGERKCSPPKIASPESVVSSRTLPSPVARTSPAAPRALTTEHPQSRPQSNPTTSSPAQAALKSSDPISSLKSLSLPTTSSSAHYIPSYPSLPLDVMASSLLSSHSLKAGIHPYLNYGRLKSSTGAADAAAAAAAAAILPVCRDPYCTNCQLSSHLLAMSAQNKSCPPGCTQCDIAKSSNFLAGGHGSSLATAYAQAQLAALAAASQMPYVCSWVGTDAAYCGKRFVTSEELLQHLRTHTSDSLASVSSAAAAHSLLNRTYPTPPLSPLSTARYHPYSKPPFLPPALFPLPGNPALHPAAAAFPPYLFYNSKLGSTPHH